MDDRELKRLRAAQIPAKRVEWGVENVLGTWMAG
jgi:hypothetical protein